MASPTIVDYRGRRAGYRCGYCKGSNSKISNGMWAHSLTVQDYQDLIDRGWRRSGKYCYKPTMDETCCPQYTIKCAALDLQVSKSQKKVIKKFNRLMTNGLQDPGGSRPDPCTDLDLPCDEGARVILPPATSLDELQCDKISDVEDRLQDTDSKPSSPVQEGASDRAEGVVGSDKPVTSPSTVSQPLTGSLVGESQSSPSISEKTKKEPRKGLGADPGKPAPKKAKELRKERWRQKHGVMDADQPQAKKPMKEPAGSKSIESLLNEIPKDAKHKLEVRLVRSSPCSEEFDETFEESYRVYLQYQMVIHGDPPTKPTERQFRSFLVDSPLQPYYREGGFPDGYGSFHQHYLIDGKLVAVGVIDILPSSISSVYLYYDPDYFYLSLGTYTALREAAFTRYLHTMEPSIQHYYMGFYIHSCPKMRYKGQYVPSFLLCPESYQWVPLETCRPKLDANKYSRLDDTGAVDAHGSMELGRIMVLHQRQFMPYQFYALLNPEEEDEEEVSQYLSLVGSECAQRILLYRS